MTSIREGVYANPGLLWGIMPVLLIWTLRMWHLCVHGRLREDPVVFAIKDRVSVMPWACLPWACWCSPVFSVPSTAAPRP